jgi:hypothetical protein
MLKLPLDERGYPVPKFVAWVDGKPDFRVVDARWMTTCIQRKVCWLCGEPLGANMAFVIGPMCCVNRVSSEPPSHYDCAEFSVKACPFLTQPNRRRDRYNELPDGHEAPAGMMIQRNPGVSLIWVTRSYKIQRHNGGVLFQIGDPTYLAWWARGRAATHEEIMYSINTGLPELRAVAERESLAAMEALEKQIKRGLSLVSQGQ